MNEMIKIMRNNTFIISFSFNCHWLVNILEIWNCTFENINLRIKILCNCLQHKHICQKSGKLSLEFHIILSDNVEHSNKEFNSLEILKRLSIEDSKQGFQLSHIFLKAALDNFLAIKKRETIDKFSTFLPLAMHNRFNKIDKINSISLFKSYNHTNID